MLSRGLTLEKYFYKIYRSVLGNRKVIYVSHPITGGTRYTAWVNSQSPVSHVNAVIEPNKLEARQVVDQLRQEYSNEVFICPADIGYIDGWTETDYADFWEDVIRLFAKEVWFLPGWCDSTGCQAEYRVAKQLNLPIREL
jgi:hypothetical protein